MERTNYGNAVMQVVDSFGNMSTKAILTEDGDIDMVLVPIVAYDCPNPDFKYYYWVSRSHF
jgi:hypothetical protein